MPLQAADVVPWATKTLCRHAPVTCSIGPARLQLFTWCTDSPLCFHYCSPQWNFTTSQHTGWIDHREAPMRARCCWALVCGRVIAFAYRAVIDACEKGAPCLQALQCIERMLCEPFHRYVITYNATMSACQNGDQWQQASELFVRMLGEGVQRDTITDKRIWQLARREGSGSRLGERILCGAGSVSRRHRRWFLIQLCRTK